jgi:hypothetical protein
MVPFIRAKEGNTYFFRVIEQTQISVKGKKPSPCLRSALYYEGGVNLKDDDLVGMLTRAEPREVLFPYGKAFADCFPERDPANAFIVATYIGKIDIGGGQTFNQWDVAEIVLTVDELKTIGV